MKISTIMSVIAVALAFVVSGCKYDKAANGGAGDAAGADNGGVSSISTDEIEAEEGDNINALAGEPRFEDMYTKCTDVSFEPVYFGFDSTMIPNGELGKVNAVASHLADHADRVVVIEGNCDERGSNEYNIVLGQSRSTIIRNCLVQGGIADDRIQVRSYGEEKPAVEGHDEAAWAKNRRGEFVIFQK